MKIDRPNTNVILIDIQYSSSMNAFEEWYGETITYQEIEQKSYVEFKDLMFQNINRDIKFRKYGRIGPILTIKAEMLSDEIKEFMTMLEKDEVKLIHDWVVTNVVHITDANEIDKDGYEEEDDNEEDIDDDF
jgi:hypothetical protein